MLVTFPWKIIIDSLKDLLKYSYFISVYIYDIYYSIYYTMKNKLSKITSSKAFSYYDVSLK